MSLNRKALEAYNKALEEELKLLEMSESRKDLLRYVDNRYWTIMFHIVKCIAYRNDSYNYNKWVKEIAVKLVEINKKKVKPDNRKLTYDEYMQWASHIENDFSLEDAKDKLDHFIDEEGDNYPEFEITKKFIEDFHDKFWEIVDKSSWIMAEDKNIQLTKEDFENLLHQVLD